MPASWLTFLLGVLLEEDKDVMCSVWAEAGECANNADYMHQYCARSCHLKSGKRASEPEQCVGWAIQGECARNPKYMMSSCPSSCAEQRAKLFEGMVDNLPDCIDKATVTSCLSSMSIAQGCHGSCAVFRICEHEADFDECSHALRCRELKVTRSYLYL